MSSDARVHVAAEPGLDSYTENRIVQPCGRCGLTLRDFDEANPPMVAGDGDTAFLWWADGEQIVRDPGYGYGLPTAYYLSGDDAGVKLCDPAELDARDDLDQLDFFRSARV